MALRAELSSIKTATAGQQLFPALEGALAVHRYRLILPGEPIVLVITASLHRGEAFAAASFLMDYLKTRAPFWKKRHLAGKGAGDWVKAKPQDHAAAQKWRA